MSRRLLPSVSALALLAGMAGVSPASAQAQYDMAHPPVYVKAPAITSIDYSPDGSMIAVAGYHEVLVHKADGSGIVARLVGLAERIQKLAWSPDGSQIALADEAGRGAIVSV